jgi:hypothetical protein
MRGIVVTETIEGIPFVVIITLSNIQDTGRTVPFAEMILKQNSMSIMERMNTTLKNWKIPLLIYRLAAQNVERLSPLDTTVTQGLGMSTGAGSVLKRRWKPFISEPNIKRVISPKSFFPLPVEDP